MARSYILYFSHTLSYKNSVRTQRKFLEEVSGFEYYDRSLEPNDPIHQGESDEALYDAIEDKIQGADAVIMLAGVYKDYGKWADADIKFAKKYKKPIILIEPWEEERTNEEVRAAADAIIDWDKTLLAETIQEIVGS